MLLLLVSCCTNKTHVVREWLVGMHNKCFKLNLLLIGKLVVHA